jgi:hypothetical protein
MSQSSLHADLRRGRNRWARRATVIALLLSLAFVTVALAAGKAPKAGTYEGTSSEKGPVMLTVAKGGVVGFKTAIGYDGKCGQGGGPGFEPRIAHAAIKNGRFSVTVTFKGEVPSIPSKKGKVTGRFSGGKVTGTVVIPSLKTKTGCLSYSETYSASWKHA